MHPLIEFSTAWLLRQVDLTGYNRRMRKFVLICCLAILLVACNEASPILPSLPPSLSGELLPYISPTPSRTPTPLPPAATVALTPIPTATPFTHTIAKGDTLLGIALRYGVSLEQLQAANPGVDPGFLVVGNALGIPLEGQASNAIPLPAPLPLPWSEPRCYANAEGGLWCFILVTNDQPNAIENLSAWISLYDAQGNPVGGQAATSPLNLLSMNASMPLMAYFAPPLPTSVLPQGQLLSALAVENSSMRYLDAALLVSSLEISQDGAQASAQGQVMIPQGSIPSTVWIVLTAYDRGGNVVGARKSVLDAPCGTPLTPVPTNTLQPTPGTGTPAFTPTTSPTPLPLVTCTEFDLTVYSLGPAIQRAEALVEARP